MADVVQSTWEHLQSVLLQVHNKLVREEFNDLEDHDDITTPRGSLRYACMLKDDDSTLETLLKYMLFYFDLRKATDLAPALYGIPVTSFQEARRFKPQIQLYFQEDIQDVEAGYSPVTGEISFRLMRETEETLTHADLEGYARKIRTAFSSGSGFIWKKGRTMCAYTERNKGYQLQLLCRSETEGRRVIEQVMDIQDHTPNWKFLTIAENAEPAERFPPSPAHQNILGRSERMPRSRPVADVRFIHATAHIYGLVKPVVLVDRSGNRRALVGRSSP